MLKWITAVVMFVPFIVLWAISGILGWMCIAGDYISDEVSDGIQMIWDFLDGLEDKIRK